MDSSRYRACPNLHASHEAKDVEIELNQFGDGHRFGPLCANPRKLRMV
eukprot:CAMPEP_0203883258 /NCGR_PEP_ID=MMETSP0359-20131031/27375_1 /ASSEMBLY_ACC=CAM_ASM_000338 /TAXON_ID=268821 /ORGANISM="Scrippsiella Hangoei, Strain SHTV-5" /LENGTH=47 /DNA_ID= /DNA_START= /DNA_END= /DNA_ORIENTATION=